MSRPEPAEITAAWISHDRTRIAIESTDGYTPREITVVELHEVGIVVAEFGGTRDVLDDTWAELYPETDFS